MIEKYQKKYSTKTKKFFKNYNFFMLSLLLHTDYQFFGVKIEKNLGIILEKLIPFLFSFFDNNTYQINSYILGKLINSTKEELDIHLNKKRKKY